MAAAPTQWLLQNMRKLIVPGLVLLMASGILVLITGHWNAWGNARTEQETDDAYLRADVTPLSTKVAGLVATVEVADYQSVKVGDLLVQLRDEDFRAQMQQAEAAVVAGEDSLINNRRQRDLQDARILQATEGIHGAEADIAAAEAGVEAAKSTIAAANDGIEAAKSDVNRTDLEQRRQQALVASESATRQKLEQALADANRFRAQLQSREAELASAQAQMASRQADLARARAKLGSTKAELEAQKRQQSVLDSQLMLLVADLKAKKAALVLAQTVLGYTRIVAPRAGIVGERKVLPGQFVSPGTQVISLVQDSLWVQANFRETQVQSMRPGNIARIKVDAFPGSVLNGRVESLSPASGSRFALLPPDNATGNFTKIVQRVPVKLSLDAGQPAVRQLRDGLSATVVIHTIGADH